jgi:hypothetical protein
MTQRLPLFHSAVNRGPRVFFQCTVIKTTFNLLYLNKLLEMVFFFAPLTCLTLKCVHGILKVLLVKLKTLHSECCGRGIVLNTPSPPSAEVKERVELYLHSTFWAFMACSRASFTFYILSDSFRSSSRRELLLHTFSINMSRS